MVGMRSHLQRIDGEEGSENQGQEWMLRSHGILGFMESTSGLDNPCPRPSWGKTGTPADC